MRKKKREQRQALPADPAAKSALAKAGARTTQRRWLFRTIAAAVVPLILLVTAECLLRVVGYGYPNGFFQRAQLNGQAVWTDNQDFARGFFPPGLVRHPHTFTIPVEKARTTLRIFVLGESAAMGDPDPKFGLPRMLEVLLREGFPDRQVEVINASMVAINSHLVRSIARDCAAKNGDLWVLYMGNNEIIGPFGSASVFGAQAPPLWIIRIGLWARTTRLGQFLDATINWLRRDDKLSPSWAGMEMMADQKVRHDAPATERVHEHFKRNLADILQIGAEAGIPTVVCNVGTNLKDCAPFASLHRADLASSDLASWQASYDAGVLLQARGQHAQAKAALDAAAEIDGEYAELTFRRAECDRMLGLDAEAAKLFRLARDQDALQFRADSRINDAIRQSADTSAAGQRSLLDAEDLFATNSPQGLIGAEYFYEHVHLTPEGNYLLARAVAETAARMLPLESPQAWTSQTECFRLLGLTDGGRHDSLEIIRDRMQAAPFSGRAGNAQQLQVVKDRLSLYRLAFKPAQVRRDLQQLTQEVAAHPEDVDLRFIRAGLLENAGDYAAAEGEWRKLMALQPHAALPRFNLAKLLERQGRSEEAYTLLEQGLRINPEHYPARYAMGDLCLQLDRVQEAVRHLSRAVRQKPSAIEPRLRLSLALVRDGRFAEAQKHLSEVLRADPANQSAQSQLRELETKSARQ